MSDTKYQQRYWQQFVELRVHVCYLHHYAAHSDWWDKAVNIFLAVTSSGSIAAWAVWKEMIYVWPALIALSQVVTAIKPFLPFKQRQKMVMDLCEALQSVSLAMEKGWFAVSEGRCTNEEIHELTSTCRDQIAAAEQKHMKGLILPRKDKLMAKAESDTRQYFLNHYS